MGPEHEHETEIETGQETGQQAAAGEQAPGPVHHKSIGEMEPLRRLPEDEEEPEEEEEVFEPGPSFGEGM